MKWIIILALLLMPNAAQAEFLITSAVLEFTKDSPTQQDIEIVSRSKTDDYLVAEVAEILNPGTSQEERRVITDPSTSRLLVTPDKTILSGGGRKTLRFVLLHPLDAKEHIYRVAIKPVIKGLENNNKVGLKILIGYEVLVIIRPQEIAASYTAQRNGAVFTVNNTGNTNILFNNGSQCSDTTTCKMPPVLRVYPSQQVTETLPLSTAVTYAVWDGKDTIEKKFE
jgi:P pilus assembly chaperone PapD